LKVNDENRRIQILIQTQIRILTKMSWIRNSGLKCTCYCRKSVEDQQRKIQDKKDRVRLAVEENRLLDTDLKRDALELQVRSTRTY
jgi:hypothetical protein